MLSVHLNSARNGENFLGLTMKRLLLASRVRNDWAGYDEYQSYKGHGRRIGVVGSWKEEADRKSRSPPPRERTRKP